MKRKTLQFLVTALAFGLVVTSCKKDDDTTTTPAGSGGANNAASLVFKFTLDSTQSRLDNLGNPATIPAGHSAQSPRFNGVSANYIEMAPDMFTALGSGEVAYQGPVTSAGGNVAIDHDQATVVNNGEVFVTIPLSQVTPGTYEWLRVSLSYQNYNIDFRANGFDLEGTIASFVGAETYISAYTINTQSITVNANKLQGYWGFEESTFNTVVDGQAPPGATTVPNPLFATSPIPQGSCIVTGQFPTALTITGNETEDIVVNISLSTNNSFEWTDANANGIYEPLDGDTVVDMGLRGMIPMIE